MQEIELPKMYTVRECAKQTGLSYECVLQLCKNKMIPFVKSGNRYLVNVRKLSEYLNTGECANDRKDM